MTGIRDEHAQIKMLNRGFLLEELLSHGDIGGRKDLLDFLRLTWKLDEMPSTDPRFSNASDDIWKHMICNDDCDCNYLFDNYLNLINGLDEQLFRFLENVVHPLVRLPAQKNMLKWSQQIDLFVLPGMRYIGLVEVSFRVTTLKNWLSHFFEICSKNMAFLQKVNYQ